MATTIRETESGIRTSGMDTAEALWTIIAAQPRKVRKELAIRLQNDLSSTRHRITELDKAIEDAIAIRDRISEFEIHKQVK